MTTQYGFNDQGYLNEGILAADTTCTITPVYKNVNGVLTKQGFDTPTAFIFFELGGVYERSHYTSLAVDATTKVTTLSGLTRGMSTSDGRTVSAGTGSDWPRGTRVVVSNDPNYFGYMARQDTANTFTDNQTIADTKKLYIGANAYLTTTDDGTNLLFKDGSNSESNLSTALASGNDEKVGIDSGATAGYIGSASNDGVLRTGDGLSYTDGGDFVTLDVTKLKDASSTELTIATGAVTATGSAHTIDTESDAATDDLDTISGGADGDYLTIWAADDARDIVVKHGTGNILTSDSADFTIDTDDKAITFRYDGTNWKEVSRATGSNIDDTAFASSWNGDTGTAPSKNTIHDAFNERTMFSGSYPVISAGSSSNQQNVSSYTKRKEVQVFFKGTISVFFSATISGGTLFSKIYVNGSAVGTERTGSGSWSEDITVAIGDLVQIYQHDNSTNYSHSVTGFEIRVSSAPTGVVNL